MRLTHGWLWLGLCGLALGLTTGTSEKAVAEAAPRPIDGLEVSGRVVDPAGKPLPGVRVQLAAVEPEGASARRWLAGAGARPPIAEGATAVDGRFSLRAPGRGFFFVTADAPGLVPMRFLLAPLLEESSFMGFFV